MQVINDTKGTFITGTCEGMGSLASPKTLPIKSGEYMNPEEALFGKGGCSDVYVASSVMVEIFVQEHKNFLDRKLERAFRKKKLETVLRPGWSSKTAWKKYWSLPLEMLAAHDQICLISAASKLIAR